MEQPGSSSAFDKLRDKEQERRGCVRDAYGFEVKPEYLSLHQQYAPLWQAEEAERAKLWAQFLEDSQQDAAVPEPGTAVLARLLAACDAAAPSDPPEPEATARLQQLRALVQAGVPMASRGKFWQLFLRIDSKREPGLYEQLVARALEGSPHASASSGASPTEGEAREGGSGKPSSKQAGLQGAPLGLPVVEIHADGSSRQAAAAPTPGAAAEQHATLTVTPTDIVPVEGEPPAAPAAAAAAADAAEAAANATAPTSGTASPAAASPQAASGGLGEPATPVSSGSYSSAGSQSTGSWRANDWLGQIEKDLHRTFPGHPSMDEAGRAVLRRILAAYSYYNRSVGYCQGLNFIAACFGLFMGEEEAFWCLAAVVEDLLAGYFDVRMIAPQVDQKVFAHLLQASVPSVMAHLHALEVDVPSVCMHWWLCMFLNALPLESCLRVWDVLFFEGSPVVLFRMALALVDVFQKALLACRECSEAYMMLQSMAPMSFDSSRLLDTACAGFGHVSAGALRVLRGKYRPEVLELMRGSFSSQDEFRAYSYYGAAAEPAHSRSQSFADAFARIAAAGSSGSGGGRFSPGAGSGSSSPPPDQGHLTPASAGAGSLSPGSEGVQAAEAGSGGPPSSGGSAGSAARRLLPAAKQAVSAFRARLVPSALPSLLPSGPMGAWGEERAPQTTVAAAAGAGLGLGRLGRRGRGERRQASSPDGRMQQQQEGEDGQVQHQQQQQQQQALLPPQPELKAGDRQGAPGGLQCISTQRGAAGASCSSSSPQEPGAAAPTFLGRSRKQVAPFSDPAQLAPGEGEGEGGCPHPQPDQPPQCAAEARELGGTEQAAKRVRPAAAEAPPAADAAVPAAAGAERPSSSLLDFRSPLRPQQLPPRRPSSQRSQSMAGGPAGTAQRAPHHRRRSLIPDLHSLAAFVPDFRQPAVAAAYKIAANPSPRRQLGQQAGQASPPLYYARTPLSSVLGVSGGSRGRRLTDSPPPGDGAGGGDSRGAVTGAVGEEGEALDPVRVLQFAEEGEEEARLILEPDSAPAASLDAGRQGPFVWAQQQQQQQQQSPRRFTDTDALGASELWSLPWEGPDGGSDSSSGSGAAAAPTAGGAGQPASTGGGSAPGAQPAAAAAAAAVAAVAAAAGDAATPARATPGPGPSQQQQPPTPNTGSQLLGVVERLQEEVATAESRRHTAATAARQATETVVQLRRQLGKVQQGVAEKERMLADLRGRAAALASELGEAEGELCAGRMAAEGLQQQLEQLRRELAAKDEHIRLLMDAAAARSSTPPASPLRGR